MTVNYSLHRDAQQEYFLTIFLSNGDFEQVMAAHPNFAEIKQVLLAADLEGTLDAVDEPALYRLLNPGLVAGDTLRRLSDRVSYANNNIYFDGDVVDNSIAEHILRLISADGSSDSYLSLVRFLEKLQQNPSESSKNSLYDFITRHNVTILADGDMLLYKGVNSDGTSRNAGYGIVDGRVITHGHLPNQIGSVVEFPRARVDADTAVGCSTGLHAGTYAYASAFARGLLLTVKVNPRDVVAVPDHVGYQKVRMSRYQVLATTEVEITTPYFADEVETEAEAEAELTTDQKADLIESALRTDDFDEVVANFNFTRPNGTTGFVREIRIKEVRLSHNNNRIIVGVRRDGATRHYRVDRVQNIAVHNDLSDVELAENLSVTPTQAASTPVTAPAVDATTTIRQQIEQAIRDTCNIVFDYTKLNGEVRHDVELEDVDILYPTSLLVQGIRVEDDEERNYRIDRITNLRLV